MKTTTIYLVRHGEVENPGHIIYGRLPRFDLSNRGRYQAEKIGDWFKTKNIAHIYTSPLLRARKTAAYISKGRIPVTTSKSLLEANYKKWEGKPADSRSIKDIESYVKNPDKIILGENLVQIQERMMRLVQRAKRKFEGKNVVIVSHADPILTVRMTYEGKPLSAINRFEIRNASVVTLRFEGDKLIGCDYRAIVDAKKDLP